MPLYDVKCNKCGKELEDVWLKMNEKPSNCECGGEMVRMCNCSHFKLLYDNKKDTVGWGYDGYASSRYWADNKK